MMKLQFLLLLSALLLAESQAAVVPRSSHHAHAHSHSHSHSHGHQAHQPRRFSDPPTVHLLRRSDGLLLSSSVKKLVDHPVHRGAIDVSGVPFLVKPVHMPLSKRSDGAIDLSGVPFLITPVHMPLLRRRSEDDWEEEGKLPVLLILPNSLMLGLSILR